MTAVLACPGVVGVVVGTPGELDSAAAIGVAATRLLGLPVALEHDGAGRPIARGPAGVGISVSRTAGATVVAVAVGGRVGVDIERVRNGPWLSLPAHALRPAELACLDAAEPSERPAVFLRYWTCKEALLKAGGVGLAIDPKLVGISPPGSPPRVEELPVELGRAEEWSLVEVDVPGCVCFVATELRSSCQTPECGV